MCNGKFRAAADDKFAAVHSNIFRVLGAQGSGGYLDRRAPEGNVPLPLHIHKSFVDRATESLPTGRHLFPFLFSFSFLFSLPLPLSPSLSVFIQETFANTDVARDARHSLFFFASRFFSVSSRHFSAIADHLLREEMYSTLAQLRFADF